MEKDLLNLENELCEEEFEKMLQDFINKEFEETNNDHDSDDIENDTDDNQDDADTHEEDDEPQKDILPMRNRKETGRLASYTLSVCVLEDCDKSCFCSGPVTVHFDTHGDELPDTDRFKCFIYTDTYYPMCSSYKSSEVYRNGMELSYEIPCSHIWLPGKYILLVRDKDQSLVRIGFQLDEHLHTEFSEPMLVEDLSIEDVLTTVLQGDEHWLYLSVRPGTVQMRQKMLERMQLKCYNDLREALGSGFIRSNRNLLICTRNKDLTEYDLHHLRIDFGHSLSLEYVDCSTLYDPACNNPYEHLNDALLSISSDDIVCLTNLSALLSTGGKVIVRRLVEKVKDTSIWKSLWLCSTRQEILTLFDQFPSLKEFYTDDSWVEHGPYSAFDMIQAFFQMMQDENLTPSLAVMDQVSRAIIEGYRQSRLVSWSLTDLRHIITDSIRPRYLKRAMADIDIEVLPIVSPEDVDMSLFTGSADTLEDCLGELNKMVGLEQVKQGIATLANNTRFFLERRRRGLPTSGNVAYHAIFTGNPGTGKTTVARMLGRIYHSLGLLSRGEVIAADRTRLVGRYIGETEENMKAVLEEARGNVLFIDEAYNLYDGSGDRKDFGARVIDSLLTVLSQPDPDMMVIFAGYEKEMDAMLNTNPGLMGRFPYKYRFSDYSPEQLMEIALRLLECDAYLLTDEALAVLKDSIAQTYKSRTTNFGNARWVEQFVRNGIIPAMADRLAATPSDDYQHIEASDVRRAYEKFNPKATELKPRRKVGFSA
ncbi:MAG: AAA family ATPase [Prevotella sp.]|nr:AAA family ATPase [Prevotella sp.]